MSTRRRRRKWPWILLFLLAAAGAGWWFWLRDSQKDAPPEYETITVSRSSLTKVITAAGEVNPLTKVEIGSQISGTIESLEVDFNSVVKAGDILCRLDPATYEANYAQAMAEKTSSEADRDLQKRTLERKQLLIDKNLFAKADFDKAESDLVRAEAQLQLSAARLKKAKVDLDRCTIYAPIDGVVIDRTAELGMTIAASFNAPKLFVLAADLTKMQINAKVSERDIGQVKLGQNVTFVVDAWPREFPGKVVQVRNSPITEENIVNYDTIIAVDNPDLELKPGMTAVVKVITAEATDILTVPNSALRFRPPGVAAPAPGPPGRQKDPAAPPEKTVYLAASAPGSPPAAVTVQIGITDGINTQILSGLKGGESVITLLKPPAGAETAGSSPFGGGRRR